MPDSIARIKQRRAWNTYPVATSKRVVVSGKILNDKRDLNPKATRTNFSNVLA